MDPLPPVHAIPALVDDDGEGSFPMDMLRKTIQEVQDGSLIKKKRELGDVLSSSVQDFTLDPMQEEFSQGRANSEPLLPQVLEEDVEEIGFPSLLEFQEEIHLLYPITFQQDPIGSEIILTSVTEKTWGHITIDALEILGKTRSAATSEEAMGGSIYWANVSNPSLGELMRLEKAFKFHPLTTEDIFVSTTREKVEEYAKYIYIVFSERQFEPNCNNIRRVNLNILLFHNFVLSIHRSRIDSFVPTLHHLAFKENILNPEWIPYKLMDLIVDRLIEAVATLQIDVRAIDGFVMQLVGSNSQEDFILRISVARQFIAELSDFLVHKRDVLVYLSSEKSTLRHPHIKLYLRDILDHVVYMNNQLHASEDVLNNVSSTYLALISIKMAEGSNQMNQVMKRFSAVATIVLPLTLVSSLWGMNVEVPGQTWGLGLLWFGIIYCAMSCWFCIGLLLFKYKNWI